MVHFKMKVLIRFRGDNDFGSVMRAFGTLLLHRVQQYPETLTPALIAGWFNDTAFTLYQIVQERPTHGPQDGIKEYLQIKPADVYIGPAVDAKMKTAHVWMNGDSVLIDGADHAVEKICVV